MHRHGQQNKTQQKKTLNKIQCRNIKRSEPIFFLQPDKKSNFKEKKRNELYQGEMNNTFIDHFFSREKVSSVLSYKILLGKPLLSHFA